MDLSTDRLTITTILIQSNSSLHMSGETDIEEVYLTKLLGIHEDREFTRQAKIERSQTVCPASILETSLFFYDKLKFYHNIHSCETSGRHSYHTEVAYERFPSQVGVQFVNNC